MGRSSRYRVARLLARDGWTETFEAYVSPGTGGEEQRVLLQRVLAEFAAEPVLQRSFLEEAQSVERIHHAGLISLLDYGLIDDLPFVVQESIEGIDLADLSDRARASSSPPPPEAVLQIALDLAYGLYHLHQVRDAGGRPIGMVHGEVRGRNALVAWRGQMKLGGLGMARLRQRVEAAGVDVADDPDWPRPPEQLAGEGVDARADIFSLGCLMHFVLVGSQPSVSKELERTDVDSSIDEDLQDIVRRAAHPTRTRRYQSAAQLAEDLSLALRSRGMSDARGSLREWASILRPTEIDTSRPRRGDLFVAQLVEGAVPDPAEGSLRNFQSALSHDVSLFSSEMASNALLLDPQLPDDANAGTIPPPPSRVPRDLGEASAEDTLPPDAGLRSPLASHSHPEPALVSPAVPSARGHGDPRIGEVLHGYRLVERIGEGSVARVYRAVHTVLPRECAVKLLNPTQAQFELSAQRMKREALMLCELHHPNLVSVLDFGITADGWPFLMLELLRGKTLKELLEERGGLEPDLAKEILRQILVGISIAHRHGLVHRDLKPANVILLEESGRLRVKILDFGLARITEAHATHLPTTLTSPRAFLGTPKYIAPEQIVGASSTGPAADLYSLGVMVHHMLAGEAPYNGSVAEIVNGQLYAQPPPLPPSGGLEKIAQWLMEKDPQKRPASAEELLEILAKMETPSPPPQPTSPPPPREPIGHSEARTEPERPASILAVTTAPSAGRTMIWVLSILLALLLVTALFLERRKAAVEPEDIRATPLDLGKNE